MELPTLLQHRYKWEVLENWYTNSTSRVRVYNQLLSEPFTIERGVKQGSVLSPTLFLIVMDQLLKQLKENNYGLSVCQTYAGAAIYADDLRTTAASTDAMTQQANILPKKKNLTHPHTIDS